MNHTECFQSELDQLDHNVQFSILIASEVEYWHRPHCDDWNIIPSWCLFWQHLSPGILVKYVYLQSSL